MDEQRYWFLAPGKKDLFGHLPRAEKAVSTPWWPEAAKWVHEEGPERVAAPMIFTTREGAQAELLELEASEADSYLQLVEEHGKADVDDALDNTLPTQVYEVSRDSLAGLLGDSDFLCVLVDGRLKLHEDLAEKLDADA